MSRMIENPDEKLNDDFSLIKIRNCNCFEDITGVSGIIEEELKTVTRC